MAEVLYIGLPKRYLYQDLANSYATATYLTWKTGQEYTVEAVRGLIREGHIEINTAGLIYTKSVEHFLHLTGETDLTKHEIIEVVKEMRQAVVKIGNIMHHFAHLVEVIAVRDGDSKKKKKVFLYEKSEHNV